MFNRYWREYPWLLQLLLFVIMIFILAGFFMKVVAPLTVTLLTEVRNLDLRALNPESPRPMIRAALIWQALSSVAIFALPSLLFAYQASPHFRAYLGLVRPGKNTQWVYVVLLMLGAIPLMLQLQAFMRMFDLGVEDNSKLITALMRMDSFGDFTIVFIIMAILPALGEELFFRGIVMRFISRKNGFIPQAATTGRTGDPQKRMFLNVGITAFMFALMHSSLYAFPSILFAGMLLGLIYYLTGSLWCSILAHLINNGLQIIFVYCAQFSPRMKTITETDQLPWMIVLGGLVLFIYAAKQLWRNKTPLQPNWSDDYLPGEQDPRTLNPPG